MDNESKRCYHAAHSTKHILGHASHAVAVKYSILTNKPV